MGKDYLLLKNSPTKNKIPAKKSLAIILALFLILLVIPSSVSLDEFEGQIVLVESESFVDGVYVKHVRVNSDLVLGQGLVNVSIPEVRYASQVDLMGVSSFDVVDTDGNNLLDTIEWDVSSSSLLDLEARVDFNKVKYKDSFSDHIDNYNGSYTALITVGSKNYYNESAKEYKPIDINVKNSKNKDFVYENTKNAIKSFFGNDGLCEFEVNGVGVSINISDQLFSNKNKNAKISKNKNQVTYKDYYSDVDLRFSILEGKVLEEFVLKKPVKIFNLSETIFVDESCYYEISSGGSIVFYSNDSDELLFTIPRPVMWEDKDLSERNYGIHYEIVKESSSVFSLTKVIDPVGVVWLENSSRKFPLVVDASFTNNSPTEDGYVVEEDEHFDRFNDADELSISYSSAGRGIYDRSYVEWPITSIPDDADVSDTDFIYWGKTADDDAKIYSIETKPTLASDAALWSDCAGGTQFVSDFDIAASPEQTEDLGSSADTDLENQLSSNWFAIGIRSEEFISTTGEIYSSEYNTTADPTLSVTYTTAAPSCTIDNVPDGASGPDVIYGNATDEVNVQLVQIRITNTTDLTFWEDATGIWSINPGQSNFNDCDAVDGGWGGETSEAWRYNATWEGVTWVAGKSYNLSVRGYDGVTYNTSYRYDLFNCITTNDPPVQGSESPNDGATGQSTQPQCAISITDGDDDYLDVHFWDNSSGGTWTLRQSNTSVLPESSPFRWTYSGASSAGTKYWWRVVAYDIYDNESANSYDDPNNKWSNEEKAYDGSTATDAAIYGPDMAGGNPLVLNLSEPKFCSKIWVYGAAQGKTPDPFDASVEAYFNRAYNMLFNGTISANTWTGFNVSTGDAKNVTGLRFTPWEAGEYEALSLYEVNFTLSDVDNETYDFTTAAGLDISVTPATWAMGEIDMSDTSNDTSASNGYFNLSNDGGSAIDVNINATNATGAGYQWTLAATADYEQYALQYDLYDGGIEAPEWVSINLTSDTFDQNIEAGGYQEFDLKILYATWASTYDPLTITITFTAVAS